MCEQVGLEFRFQDILQELDSMDKILDDFCAPSSRKILSQTAGQLKTWQSTRAETLVWQIPQNRQFETIVTTDYEGPNKDGGYPVSGAMCFIWELRKKAGSKGRNPEVFQLFGKASAKFSINCESVTNPVEWTMEVGDWASPGCHFHYQLAHEHIPVPRLPGLLFTPTDVLDFMLGELFQDKWKKNIARKGHERDTLRKLQGARLQRVLGALAEQANHGWQGAKSWKPTTDIFIKK